MATVTRVVDDLNPELDATTRTFRLFDHDYEIDLSDGNAPMLAEALSLITKARPVNGRSKPENGEGGISSNRRSRSNGKSVSNSRTKKKPVRKVQRAVDGAAPKAVRQWCLDNDVPVSPTGIIQKSAYEAYNEAHKKD